MVSFIKFIVSVCSLVAAAAAGHMLPNPIKKPVPAVQKHIICIDTYSKLNRRESHIMCGTRVPTFLT